MTGQSVSPNDRFPGWLQDAVVGLTLSIASTITLIAMGVIRG